MKKEFATQLNQWYQADHRDLPFRRLNDPYAIWVSEVMAQQTRIESMLPYYERWMNKWPSIESLAQAKIEDVLHLWQGLGYYNRARKLHEGAKQICELYHGKMPETKEELLKIPGIGPYTAGAVLSICFNQKEAAVDGNVLRVISRLDEMQEDVSSSKVQKQISKRVEELMEEPSIFTQALMELGARVCTPKNPSCFLCPVNEHCSSYQKGTQENYPVKKPKKKPIELEVYTYLIVSDHCVLLSSDDSDGLMKGLKRLPQFDAPLLIDAKPMMEMKHVFSHRIWKMKIYHSDKKAELENCFWCPVDQLDEVSMVTAHRKILQRVFGLK